MALKKSKPKAGDPKRAPARKKLPAKSPRQRTLRNQQEMSERRQKAAAMYRQGMTVAEIGAVLGVSHVTIAKDLKAVRQMWMEEALIDFSEHQARELAKLDALEKEAWDAWIKSKGEQRESTAKRITGGDGGDRSVVSQKTIDSPGDPRFLSVVLSVAEKRRRLIGSPKPDMFDASERERQSRDENERRASPFVGLIAAINDRLRIAGS